MSTVLYVDDDPALLDLGKQFLERSGTLNVDTASSVEEAIDKISNHTYDGIISDYQMPVQDGIELLRYIRSHYTDLPFILFTGRGREEIAIEALNNGADFYIQKGGEQRSQFAELEHKLKVAIDRKRTHDELRESRNRITGLIESLPDATFAINREHCVIAWNKTMELLTGIPPDAILGTGGYSQALRYHNEQRPILVDLILKKDEDVGKKYPGLNRNGDKFITELYSPTIYHGKGGYIWLIASPLYDTAGNVIGAVESIRDISDRKEAEEQLRRAHEELNAAYEQLTATEEELRQNYDELTKSQQDLSQSEARYRSVVEDQTEFICRFFPDGSHIFVNDAYCRYFGKTPQEIIGQHFVPDIPEEDRPMVKKHFASITPGHSVATVEHRICMPNGEIRWQQWSDRGIFDDAGNIIEYQSVGRDISDRRRIDYALYEANKKLNLLSGITRHDILNQLTVLQGYLELVEGKVWDPEVGEFVNRAIRSCGVIRNQILFTRQYQDIGVKTPRWQDVTDLALRVSQENGYQNVAVDENLIGTEIFSDPLLETVFQNLFENAVMHGGSQIRVRVCGETTPAGFSILVEDDGIGIPLPDKQKIFEKGYGTHTGLGLFFVREVLAITGLSIEETGPPGKGARFEIHVPKGMFRHGAMTGFQR